MVSSRCPRPVPVPSASVNVRTKITHPLVAHYQSCGGARRFGFGSCLDDGPRLWRAASIAAGGLPPAGVDGSAACAGMAIERSARRVLRVPPPRAICSTCEVRPQCLAYARSFSDTTGAWAVTSERERRRLGVAQPQLSPCSSCAINASDCVMWSRVGECPTGIQWFCPGHSGALPSLKGWCPQGHRLDFYPFSTESPGTRHACARRNSNTRIRTDETRCHSRSAEGS
jgi:hypothetical protein